MDFGVAAGGRRCRCGEAADDTVPADQHDTSRAIIALADCQHDQARVGKDHVRDDVARCVQTLSDV